MPRLTRHTATVTLSERDANALLAMLGRFDVAEQRVIGHPRVTGTLRERLIDALRMADID